MNIQTYETIIATEFFKMIGDPALLTIFLFSFMFIWMSVMGLGLDSAFIIAMSVLLLISFYGTLGSAGLLISGVIFAIIIVFALLKLLRR